MAADLIENMQITAARANGAQAKAKLNKVGAGDGGWGCNDVPSCVFIEAASKHRH